MKTTVVCGLLGSGKTTFIRNFVAGRSDKTGKSGKTVVLVNDFAKAGIDGEIFSAGNIESVELPSGCICCTLKLDLVTSIQNIVAQFSPEHLLIEPSGVASPSGVLEAIESAGTGSASVIGIVDSTEFAELYESEIYGSFFEDQIVNSDVILVNKIDLAEPSAIDAAERLISIVNPRAILFRTVSARIDMPLPDAPRQRMIVVGNSHLKFETFSFKLADKMEFALVQQIFDDLSRGKFGRVVRAKALVNTTNGPYRFDSAFGKTDAARFGKEITANRMVVIGESLDDASIAHAVQLSP